jgi:hypothetical protein
VTLCLKNARSYDSTQDDFLRDVHRSGSLRDRPARGAAPEGVGATEGFRAGALHQTAAAGAALADAADSGAALPATSEEAVQIRNR